MLFACYREHGIVFNRKDSVIIVHPAKIVSLDPRFIVDAYSSKISELIFEPLFRIDEKTGNPVPVLAEKIVFQDRKTALVKLKKGIMFHDMHELSCKDVVFTFKSIMDPKNFSPFQSVYAEKWKEIKCGKTRYDVIIKLRKEYGTFFLDLGMGIVRKPGQANKLYGTGAFTLDSFNPKLAILSKFSKYHGAKPNFDHFVIRVIEDESLRILYMISGRGDILVNGVSPVVANALRRFKNINVNHSDSIIITYMLFNLRDPLLSKKELRYAIAMGIDRNSLIKEIFKGMAKKSYSMLHPSNWAFLKLNFPYMKSDAKKAKEIVSNLKARLGKNGFIFKLKVSNNRLRRLVARRIASFLKKIGLNIEIVSYEVGTFLSDVRKGNFDLAILQLPMPIDPDIYHWMLYSKNIPGSKFTSTPFFYLNIFSPFKECKKWMAHEFLNFVKGVFHLKIKGEKGYMQGNRTFFENPFTDCALDLAKYTVSREKRKKYYDFAQKIIYNQIPILPLWREDNIVITSKRIKNVKVTPSGKYYLFNGIKLLK